MNPRLRPALIGLLPATIAGAAVASIFLPLPRVWEPVAATVLLAVGTGAIALPAGVLLALLLVKTDVPGRRAAALVLTALLFVPLYLQAAGWDAGLGLQGWLTLESGGMAQPLFRGWWAAVWVHGMAAIPWVTLIVGVGLSFVEPEQEEAALLDGGPASALWHVTLKRALAAAAVAGVWVALTAAGEITVTDKYQVDTLGRKLYLDVPYAESLAAVGMGVAPIVCAVAVLAALALAAIAAAAPAAGELSLRAQHVFRLGRARVPAAGLLWLTILLLVGVPLGNLIYKAGAGAEKSGGVFRRTWSANKLLDVLAHSPVDYREEIGWTALIGAVAATLALLLAAPLAWLARRGGWRAIPALSIAALCLALPGPLIGLGVGRLLNQRSVALLAWLYDRSIAAPTLAAAIRALPAAALILWFSFRTLPEETLEAAQVDGASPWSRFFRVAALQRTPALAACWLIAFAVAAGDLAATILVLPPGVDTVARRVFGLLHSGVDDQVAGIALTSALGYTAIAAAAAALLWAAARRSSAGRR